MAIDATRIEGWRCPTDLAPDPFVVRLARDRSFDDSGHETTERINGIVICPHCGLAWPVIEEPDAWCEQDGKMVVTEYDLGTAWCLECDRVFVSTFEGCFELKLKN